MFIVNHLEFECIKSTFASWATPLNHNHFKSKTAILVQPIISTIQTNRNSNCTSSQNLNQVQFKRLWYYYQQFETPEKWLPGWKTNRKSLLHRKPNHNQSRGRLVYIIDRSALHRNIPSHGQLIKAQNPRPNRPNWSWIDHKKKNKKKINKKNWNRKRWKEVHRRRILLFRQNFSAIEFSSQSVNVKWKVGGV